MADDRKYAQLQPFTLAGSGPVIGDTSVTITSFQDIEGNDLAITDFGTKGYGTLEPGAQDQEEQISFTGVTQNANGTATLTGVKNVTFLYPYTETAGLTKSHPGGATFVISNTSGFYDNFANKNDDETIAQTWTFTDPNIPRLDTTGTYGAGSEKYFATKQYVDDTAFNGAPDASTTQKGIVQQATLVETQAGTEFGSTGAPLFVNPSTLLPSLSVQIISATYGGTITAGQPVYFNTSTSKWERASAAAVGTSFTAFGIALDSGVLNDTGKRVQYGGIISSLSGLTVGYVYLGDTVGTFSSSPGTLLKLMGYALSSTTLLIFNTLDVSALYSANSDTTQANLNEAMTFFANTAFSATQANTLTAGSTSDAGALHYHKSKCGVTTYDLSTASGNQTIAHGLGRTPNKVRMTAYNANSGSDNTIAIAQGCFDGVNTAGINAEARAGGNSGSGNSSTNILTAVGLGGGQQTATVSVDATNVTLAWTKSSTPTGTIQILWEVE